MHIEGEKSFRLPPTFTSGFSFLDEKKIRFFCFLLETSGFSFADRKSLARRL
jgi:hypothetical protein